ncbi:MAG: ornithine cyclodeaminase family protein [Alphaproteobacteria bacterium]|nr:ornithine cyclodeaminase family protein [Alphaproteobacteria bacterium]
MRILSAADVEAALEPTDLIEALREAFRRGAEVPERTTYPIETAGAPGSLMVMPAWRMGHRLGVGTVTVFPDNADRGRPVLTGAYQLLDATTGQFLALIDGPALVKKRTAAASALASGYLSRPDSQRLLVVGTGQVVPHLVMAHLSVRPIKEVLVWGRSASKSKALARGLNRFRIKVRATEDLEGGVRGADIVSTATLSDAPLIKGDWVMPGTHLDLVGSVRPDRREVDDDTVAKARLFVDTREGALTHGGDLTQAIASGRITPDDIAADLEELTRGFRAGRRFHNQITLFKSVGTALEDLAAADLALRRS